MITLEQYLSFCDQALDGYVEVVGALGDDLVNARLPGIEGSNSAFALVTHVAGMASRWGRTVNRGIPVPRDRDAEFTAAGTAAEALVLLRQTRVQLHEDARAASPAQAPQNPAFEEDGSLSYATQGEVLLHVYEELAQHLGQLEVTRDALLAGRDDGARGARAGTD